MLLLGDVAGRRRRTAVVALAVGCVAMIVSTVLPGAVGAGVRRGVESALGV